MSKYESIKKFFFSLHYIRMEATSQNNSVNAIKKARKLLNETRGNLSREETKKIRDKHRKKETVYNFLKEKEQKGSLTNREKNVQII